GAQGEEVDLLRPGGDQGDGGGHLDGDPQGDVGGVLQPLAHEARADPGPRLQDEVEQLAVRHQGDEDAHGAQGGGAEDGPDLLAEELLEGGRFEDEAPVEGAGGDGAHVGVGGQLVRAEVEGADADGAALHHLEELAVDPDLLVLGGQGAAG